MKPIFLLDVDGVINAFGDWAERDREKEGWPEYKCFNAHSKTGSYLIRYAPALIDRLNALADRVEFRWLTTWHAETDEAIAKAVGFQRGLPHLGEVDHYASPWWKLQPAIDCFNEGHGLIWADDDLQGDFQSRTWVRSQEPHELLPLTPNMTVGLTPKHMDQVEEWLQKREASQ